MALIGSDAKLDLAIEDWEWKRACEKVEPIYFQMCGSDSNGAATSHALSDANAASAGNSLSSSGYGALAREHGASTRPMQIGSIQLPVESVGSLLRLTRQNTESPTTYVGSVS